MLMNTFQYLYDRYVRVTCSTLDVPSCLLLEVRLPWIPFLQEERAEGGDRKEVGIDVPTEVQASTIVFSPPGNDREMSQTPAAEEAKVHSLRPL